MNYEIKYIIGEDHQRRGIAFLCTKERGNTVKSIYDKLDKKSKDMLKTRFEYWQSGKTHKKYFHGWDQSQYQGKYTNCFVFKLGEHRFYGFLRSKVKQKYPGYQVCIIVLYAEKNDWETYEPDLKKVETMRSTLAVQRAVENYFKGKL